MACSASRTWTPLYLADLNSCYSFLPLKVTLWTALYITVCSKVLLHIYWAPGTQLPFCPYPASSYLKPLKAPFRSYFLEEPFLIPWVRIKILKTLSLLFRDK